MVTIETDFDIEGALQEDPFLSRYELQLMFDQTKQSMSRTLQRQLSDLTCEEHGAEPTVIITGRYDAEREELDISYHVDTCCKPLLLRVVQRMNNA